MAGGRTLRWNRVDNKGSSNGGSGGKVDIIEGGMIGGMGGVGASTTVSDARTRPRNDSPTSEATPMSVFLNQISFTITFAGRRSSFFFAPPSLMSTYFAT